MNFQEIYKEMIHSAEMIHALLDGVSQQEAQIKPTAKSWSILEVICHLYDLEREDFRAHLDAILRQNPEEYKSIDPQAWVKQRKYNQQDFKTMKAKFFRERNKSLFWLKSLKRPDWNANLKFDWGVMSAGVMLTSWAAHDNLHIRQLVELRRNLIERKAKPFDICYAGDW